MRKYDTSFNPEWEAEVDRWEWQKVDARLFRKTGSCPSCHHPIWIDFVVSPILSLLPTVRRHRPPKRVFAECVCEEDHPGRPESVDHGCGAHGRIARPAG